MRKKKPYWRTIVSATLAVILIGGFIYTLLRPRTRTTRTQTARDLYERQDSAEPDSIKRVDNTRVYSEEDLENSKKITEDNLKSEAQLILKKSSEKPDYVLPAAGSRQTGVTIPSGSLPPDVQSTLDTLKQIQKINRGNASTRP